MFVIIILRNEKNILASYNFYLRKHFYACSKKKHKY